jgi:TonB family protein
MTEPQDHQDDSRGDDEHRRPYRPPVGMPLRRDGRWGAPFSVAVHVLLILLLITPFFASVMAPELFPGGGPGPAGGGGGGTGGFGGWRPEAITPERLRYMRIAPEPPPEPATEEATEPTTPPPKEETPPPQPDPPAAEAAVEETAPAAAPLPGTGGGTGNDGTSGTGPGTGGGVGSGVGTGTGSANGPGTGGGEGRDYLPTPDFLPLPPEPRPGRVRGRSVAVTFTVNERGDIVSLDFGSTGDRGYDRRFRERLREARFRPAVGPDGQPIPATFPITFQL